MFVTNYYTIEKQVARLASQCLRANWLGMGSVTKPEFSINNSHDPMKLAFFYKESVN